MTNALRIAGNLPWNVPLDRGGGRAAGSAAARRQQHHRYGLATAGSARLRSRLGLRRLLTSDRRCSTGRELAGAGLRRHRLTRSVRGLTGDRLAADVTRRGRGRLGAGRRLTTRRHRLTGDVATAGQTLVGATFLAGRTRLTGDVHEVASLNPGVALVRTVDEHPGFLAGRELAAGACATGRQALIGASRTGRQALIGAALRSAGELPGRRTARLSPGRKLSSGRTAGQLIAHPGTGSGDRNKISKRGLVGHKTSLVAELYVTMIQRRDEMWWWTIWLIAVVFFLSLALVLLGLAIA